MLGPVSRHWLRCALPAPSVRAERCFRAGRTAWGLSRLDSYSPTGELPEVQAELDPTSQTTRYLDAAGRPVTIDRQGAGRCPAPPTTRSGADGDAPHTDDGDGADGDEYH
ncbi:putative ATP-grasp-modified RiPP [Streptomyces chattanoogensis]|uniref:putative ATP-grasp-modified RiPP n=1 Tax=Streptomyces chattanoogensis TaxID=66876 RepID=UPI0036D0DF88